jgi:hypothetical protein
MNPKFALGVALWLGYFRIHDTRLQEQASARLGEIGPRSVGAAGLPKK